MKANFVIDPLIGKRQQLLLATQLCRMVSRIPARATLKTPTNPLLQVLKINNVIVSGNDDNEF